MSGSHVAVNIGGAFGDVAAVGTLEARFLKAGPTQMLTQIVALFVGPRTVGTSVHPS